MKGLIQIYVYDFYRNFETCPWSNWEPISGENFYESKYFEIGDSLDVKKLPAEWKELDEFWDSLKLKEMGGKWTS